MLFLLISSVLSAKYCIGSSQESCENVCKSFSANFDGFFQKIPNDDQLSSENDQNHEFYISYNTDYVESNHSLFFCDKNIHLIYKNPKTISMRENLYVDSNKISNEVPLEFDINTGGNYYYLTIEVYTEVDCKIKPFIIMYYSNQVFLTMKFLTDDIPENLITISDNSLNFHINEITENVQKIFTSTEKLISRDFNYYCISDKTTKCQDYLSHNPIIINSPLEMNRFPSFLIVETSKPQVLIINTKKYYHDYVHVVSSIGSDITCYSDAQLYTILHKDSIEMNNFYFEGSGSLTLSVSSNVSLHSTSKINNNHFTLKTKHPFRQNESYIYPIIENKNLEIDNKIQIHEYSLFHGPKSLSGLFEPEKYLSNEELTYNVDVNNLKETDFDYVTYFFKEGNHEIPTTWKRPCRFEGINPNKTNFIFNEVHSYDGYKIDNFIDVNFKPSKSYNMITIKPANYFNLSSFGNIYQTEYNEKFTIVVEKDFIMYGYYPYGGSLDDDEISNDQCTINGKGTIYFYDEDFMKKVNISCQINEDVELKLNPNKNQIYVCVGQSDIDKCKSEIDGIEAIQNVDWVWIHNLKTRQKLCSFSNTFVTDKQMILDEYYPIYYGLTITANSIVTISYGIVNNYYNLYIHIYKNGINGCVAQSRTAKLIILFDRNDYYYYNNNYNKQVFYIYDYEQPNEIDFQVHFYSEYVKLYMMYSEQLPENWIRLTGKAQIFVRKPFENMIKIFKYPETITFLVNIDYDYLQICYSNKPEEDHSLYDFVLCNNIDDYKIYVSKSTRSLSSHIFLDFSLDFNINYNDYDFHFYDEVTTVSIDLPSNITLSFYSNYFNIFEENNSYRKYFYFSSNNCKFIFNINDNITLHYDYISSSTMPSIEFTSSKQSIEVFANPYIKKADKNYKIKVSNSLKIYSPVVSYIKDLFDTESISYSTNWNYYHFSDEGRNIYDTIESKQFTNFENDDELPDNIVLAVGKNDSLMIPLNWTKIHNFYILQGDDDFIIYKPIDLAYNDNGLILNYKFNIVGGCVNIIVPEIFTINSNLSYFNYYKPFNFISKLDCSENSKTQIYTGSITYYNYISINIYNYNSTNKLIITANNENEIYYLKRLLSFSNDNVNYRLTYDSICYCTDSDYNSKCSGKYFLVKDITTLFHAISDYPNKKIDVFNDLFIPYSTSDHLILNPMNESIAITLPYSPTSMLISDNIQLSYSDSTFYEIINKSFINVNLKDSLAINIDEDTDSSIKFSLGSNVYVSIQSEIYANFSISVEKNSHYFYTEDNNTYENIFNGELESYIRVCAYDLNSESNCTYLRNNTIQNIFVDSFEYDDVEIALSSNPQTIFLPSISKQVKVNILPINSSNLILKKIKILQITPDYVMAEKYWKFEGDTKVLTVQLDASISLSVINEITTPIKLQLTKPKTNLDLRDFDEQNVSLISILKSDEKTNEIIVSGSDVLFNNFISNVNVEEGINIIQNGTQKYLCMCKNGCAPCKEGVEGIIQTDKSIEIDPGEDVKIRVFTNLEISSTVFTNDHEVYINPDNNLKITQVSTVNQNIESGMKVDKLIFENVTNLLIKPKDISLNIVMKEGEKGPRFSIEVEQFLRLEVNNSENENIKSSVIDAFGYGELNCYDYPFDRIRTYGKIKVIKGVYIICNSRAGNNVCSYESAYRFKTLDTSDFFRPDFDQYSKIIVFLDSYTSDIKVSADILKNQKINFIKNPSKSSRLLEGQNRLIIESTKEILNSENSTELLSWTGGTEVENADSDLYVVAFKEDLTIKQEGNLTKKLNKIVIQPMNKNATIVIDDSVDIEKQKFKIETENDDNISITVITNKEIDNDILNSLIEADVSKVSISIGNKTIFDNGKNKKPQPEKKKINVSLIVGIVVGAVALLAIIIIIIIFVVKRKKRTAVVIDDNDFDDESDSTF